jgi:trehalose 6-phosphate synthase/phosphatase
MPKLIIASNRLPVTITKKNNKFDFIQSVGGLATGLSSLSIENSIWVGYPGISHEKLTQNEIRYIIENLIGGYGYYPVFIENEDYDLYYNGFCNKTIWPLFHYFPYITDFDKKLWESYIRVNIKFFDEITKIVEHDDIVWVHDYQLMLLPKLIKEKMPWLKVGFFLHIPFPSFELFRLLPWRKELLEGIIYSDLIGFHTYSYYRHFLSSVLRILGHDDTFGQIMHGNQVTKVDVFPMGIDYDRYFYAKNMKSVKKEINIINKIIKRKKIILSIDRLDYTKGILNRLTAFDLFLEKYPQYIEKISMILVVVPSRIDVNIYVNLKNLIDETIGRINGKYSKLDWMPIIYMYKSLDFNQLAALYSLSDIALLTPLRDGMNLIAKEYLASQNYKKGVLIISEMAGVSEELGEALVINPYDFEAIADAIFKALNMSPSEISERIKLMQMRLKKNSVFKWANDFIEKLKQIEKIQKELNTRFFNNDVRMKIIENFYNSKNKLIILDYDGTLKEFKKKPDEAKPDDELLDIIKKLIRIKDTEVVIISGRAKDDLEKWFGNLDINLVAEHGVWIKENDKDWRTIINLDFNWKNDIKAILETYVDRTPKTFIEEKDYSLVWHYRNADPEFAEIRAKELKGNLLNIVANLNLGIMEGNKVLEIKNIEVNKGRAAQVFLKQKDYDFIIAIGDDTTDEDVFSILPEKSYSIKVGLTISKAKYNASSYKEIRELLKMIGNKLK